MTKNLLQFPGGCPALSPETRTGVAQAVTVTEVRGYASQPAQFAEPPVDVARMERAVPVTRRSEDVVVRRGRVVAGRS